MKYEKLSDMNERITQLADHVRDQIKKLIEEAGPSIIEAIDVARESVEEDKELVVSVPVSVKWNLDTNKIEVSVSVAVKHKFTHEGTLDDPAQIPLIDRDGNTLPETVSKPLQRLDRTLREAGAKVDFKMTFGPKEFDACKKAADGLEGGGK